MPKINIDIDEDLFLPVFRPLLNSDFNIEFLYGSRDSGKSRHIAQQLILKCLANKKFKCPLIRKVANTVKDSQWTMIKEVVEEWKLDHLFNFTRSPLEIRCISGGTFLARGMDEPKKIKSLTNPTDAWIEEGADLTADDWTIITTSLRSTDYETQIYFSFNPDLPGDYETHWLFERYFSFTKELSFAAIITETLLDNTEVEIKYRCTHSTFYDNPFCKPSRKAYYEGLKSTSEYEYNVYALGLWGRRKTGGEFLEEFKVAVHAAKKLYYDPESPICISIDSNVLPYIAISCWQLIRGRWNDILNAQVWQIRQIAELPAEDPDNTASKAARKVVRWLNSLEYTGYVYLYGDRSTKARNNIDDNKRSFFEIINETIRNAGFETADKMLSFAPPVRSMGDFINAILRQELSFAEIQISNDCRLSKKDYSDTKKDKDGAILKINKADYEGGPSYQHEGHFTDTMKDFIVAAFFKEYNAYLSRNRNIKAGGVQQITRPNKNVG